MVQALASDGIECLPLPPVNPMPYRQRLAAVREFSTGTERLRDAGGRVTSFKLGPRWLMPPMVLATSPEAIRDILSTKDDSVDKTTPVFDQVRRVIGASLTDLPFEQWKPRRRTLQPVFTKQRVSEFGGHMEQAAQSVSESWHEDALIDLDAECRTITLRALGRSVLGLDLEQRADEVVEPLRIALAYAVRRATRPLRAPRWLPTPARHRARAASAKLHALTREILRDCRADPTRVAPLVHALLAAEDPETGKRLSDDEICDELVMFLFAGHDTTTTALTYALWSLGHHTDCQNRVAAEVAALPDRPLTSDDIPQLGYTVQVIRESLRLCPRRLRGHAWHPATSKSAATGCQGHDAHRGANGRTTRPAALGRPASIRPGTIQPGELQGSRSVAIRALRRRPPLVHRRPFRHARSHTRLGDTHPGSRNSLTRRRISARVALHHDRRRSDPRARPTAPLTQPAAPSPSLPSPRDPDHTRAST